MNYTGAMDGNLLVTMALLWAPQATGPGAPPVSLDSPEVGPVVHVTADVPRPTQTYRARAAGFAHVWAAATGLDPRLTIRDATGDEWTDDDTGGGTAAYLRIPIRAGDLLRMTVESGDGATGPVELHVAEEVAHDADAAAELERWLERSNVGPRSIDVDAARSDFGAAMRALIELLDAWESEEVAAALWESVGIAQGLGAHDLARDGAARVLAFRSRVLPPSHPSRLVAAYNLAVYHGRLGDPAAARELLESIVATMDATGSARDVLSWRPYSELARARWRTGDLEDGRAMYDRCLAVMSGEPPLLRCMIEEPLAALLHELGEGDEALLRFEHVHAVRRERLTDDDPQLQLARSNLSLVLRTRGELIRARALSEAAVASLSRTEHPHSKDLQLARASLASILLELGEPESARRLYAEVVLVAESATPPDEEWESASRVNLAIALTAVGDLPGASDQLTAAIDALEGEVREDHASLRTARLNLGDVRRRLGDFEGAARSERRALDAAVTTLPADYWAVTDMQATHAWTLRCLGEHDRAAALVSSAGRGMRASLTGLAAAQTPRRVESSAIGIESVLSVLLSTTRDLEGPRALEANEAVFCLIETARGAALLAARLQRTARHDPALEARRERLRRARSALAQTVRAAAPHADLETALRERDQAEAELLALSETTRSGMLDRAPTPERLAAALEADETVVAYRRYHRAESDPEARLGERYTESLLAFVLGPNGTLERVELGPIAPIRAAADAWRTALGTLDTARTGRGVGSLAPERRGTTEDELRCGRALYRLVLAPIRGRTDAPRMIVALDDALHLVPIDALPLESERLGDRVEVEIRSSLWELLAEAEAPRTAGTLVAVGGIDYGPDESPGAYRPLPGTMAEVEELAALWTDVGGAEPSRLTGRDATREALARAARDAVVLHLATHGYFAPDSVRSAGDARPVDAILGVGRFASPEEKVRELAPLVLCGLALAGANHPTTDRRTIDGVVTGEEIVDFDLAGCSLAVLSACDTHVGSQRPGQSMASLQRAFRLAGAARVVSSLWRVGDTATRELMGEFYRLLLVERLSPRQALWRAKTALRAAKTESGRSRYTVRDWAGFVLTGA